MAGPARRIKGPVETRFRREVSWAVNAACKKPSWDREWRRKREPQSCGSYRAVALDGVEICGNSATTTWASVLDKSRRRGARSYWVMPADREFPISIGYWQI